MSKSFSNDIKLIKRPHKALKRSLVIFFTLLVGFLLVLGGKTLSHLLIGREFNFFSGRSITIKEMNYYAIVFGEFESKNEALDCAVWTASSGGSSYIYAENTYFVIGQLYKAEDEAIKVVENFSEDLTYKATIKQFKINKVSFKIDDLSKSDRKRIVGTINLIEETISEVLNISNEVDKNQISNVSASSKINSLKSKVKIARMDLLSKNISFNDETLQGYLELFLKIEDSLDVCVNKLLTSDSYNTVCKYCACEIMFDYYDLCKNL